MSWLKENWFRASILIVVIGLLGWIEIRPAIIKNKCSWVKKHDGAFPGRPAKTQEEIDKCKLEEGRIFCDLFKESESSRPAKDWIEKASPSEYQFCLHNNGL